MQLSVKRLAEISMLTALALIFSYIEFLVPISIGLPGVKLGIANIVIVIALFRLGSASAFIINIIRILLSALLFGNMFSAIYALCGGIISILIMMLLKKIDKFSIIGVSMAGGVFHNLGQIAAAAVIMNSVKVFLYLPLLILCGTICGIINGIISILVLKKLRSV